LLTATPGEVSPSFTLETDDYENETLARRLNASIPARLITLAKTAKAADIDEGDGVTDGSRLDRFVEEVRNAASDLRNESIAKPSIAAVVNRVGRARVLFERLRQELTEIDLKILLIGPARPVDRDEIVKALDPIRTGAARPLRQSILIVATQCIEVGVDLDLDGLITEASPVDALRQRFGRLNRSGREFTPDGAIIAMKSSWADDPVYGASLKSTWDYLNTIRANDGRAAIVDFGLNAFSKKMTKARLSQDALSPKDDAPILLPAHLDLLSQTSPVPSADPEVGLYLHGVRALFPVFFVGAATIQSRSGFTPKRFDPVAPSSYQARSAV
jgi:CRISPR-associated endonuclease/helicase Cas3